MMCWSAHRISRASPPMCTNSCTGRMSPTGGASCFGGICPGAMSGSYTSTPTATSRSRSCGCKATTTSSPAVWAAGTSTPRSTPAMPRFSLPRWSATPRIRAPSSTSPRATSTTATWSTHAGGTSGAPRWPAMTRRSTTRWPEWANAWRTSVSRGPMCRMRTCAPGSFGRRAPRRSTPSRTGTGAGSATAWDTCSPSTRRAFRFPSPTPFSSAPTSISGKPKTNWQCALHGSVSRTSPLRCAGRSSPATTSPRTPDSASRATAISVCPPSSSTPARTPQRRPKTRSSGPAAM